jgi:hypothetical protein
VELITLKIVKKKCQNLVEKGKSTESSKNEKNPQKRIKKLPHKIVRKRKNKSRIKSLKN